MAKNISLEHFVNDCKEISRLATVCRERDNLNYFSVRGLRSGVEIMDDVIRYFSGDAEKRNRQEDASVLQTAEFGLQTLRDSCEIEQEDYGKVISSDLRDLRDLIRTVGNYSIALGNQQYLFSRVVPLPGEIDFYSS